MSGAQRNIPDITKGSAVLRPRVGYSAIPRRPRPNSNVIFSLLFDRSHPWSDAKTRRPSLALHLTEQLNSAAKPLIPLPRCMRNCILDENMKSAFSEKSNEL
jgi:hypothetical protein